MLQLKMQSRKMKTDFVVIPAYNEGKRIGPVLKEVLAINKNVIVVDDGSRDSTEKEVLKHKVFFLKHIINMGKGAALKTGVDYALKQGAKRIVVMDSDGQHQASEIPKFFAALEKNDIVFGYRVARKNMPAVLRFGNWFINFITYVMYGLKLKDTQSGYRAFTNTAYRKVRWDAQDYSMESEMIANAGKHKLKYTEIPIATIYGNKYKGTTVIDGIKIVLRMVWWRLSR